MTAMVSSNSVLACNEPSFQVFNTNTPAFSPKACLIAAICTEGQVVAFGSRIRALPNAGTTTLPTPPHFHTTFGGPIQHDLRKHPVHAISRKHPVHDVRDN